MAAFHPQTQIGSQHQQLYFGYQGTVKSAAPLPQMEASGAAATLLVRHLPEVIPHDLLSRLFSHYGASTVRPCAGGKMRNCAFVDFKDETLASQAQSQLNRLRFLGKVLSVERAGKVSDDKQSEMQSGKDLILPPASLLKDAQVPGDISKGCIAGSVPECEPIAPKLGVDYPFPPHLDYAYPPPDGNILTNIVNALIAVPRFYIQVLHLMNKMNIPAPFRMALPTPPLPPSVPHPPPPPPPPPQAILLKPNVTDLSSDESEMESSDEGDANEKNKNGRKRTRREAIVGPAVDKTVAHEAVGVKPATLVPKEIRVIKKKHPVLQIKITPKSVQNEAMDDGCSMKEPSEPTNEGLEPKPFATPEEIERRKLPPEEILSLPMFKNYTAGNPTTVLYIKNLAKDVVLDDFYYIFGSLFGSIEIAKMDMNVKLMQEGRMRGQAFVMFPSADLAYRALNLVNGYVFKGKPMIIQFGRNPVAAKTN